MDNPTNARTAAYLATRERLDTQRKGHRTTRRLRCIPPNRVCGGRCIPPDWDCRLKGEGNDPHLTAVGKGADPVAGLANVERGITRIRKGVLSLSISELEGGRKAISRGAAKLSPGDLKKKEEIKQQVYFFMGRVLLPASAIVGAGLLHKGLGNFKGYREGPGRQVDEAARSAFDLVRTNIPGYGAAVRQRQQVGIEAANAMGRITTSIATAGPAGVLDIPGRRNNIKGLVAAQTSTGIDPDLNTALSNSLRSVDGMTNNRRRPSGLSYVEWHPKSVKAFWSTPRTTKLTPSGIDTNGSVFSVHATNDLLARSFGFEPPTGAALRDEGNLIINRLSDYLRQTGQFVSTSMREMGLNPRSANDVGTFLERRAGNVAAQAVARRTLISAVTGKDYDIQAKNLYTQTIHSYDELFKRVSEDIGQAPAIDIVHNRGNSRELAALRNLRSNSFYNQAIEAHSAYLGRTMNLPSPIYGPYTGRIARQAYHARYVTKGADSSSNQNIRIRLTSTEAFNAGIEIAKATSRPEPGNARSALSLVNEAYGHPIGLYQRPNALAEILLVRGSQTRPTPSTPAAPAVERPARRRVRSRSAIIADLLKQRAYNPTTGAYEQRYTPESAATEADRLIALRRQDTRSDAYLQVREDYTNPQERLGKPCGKSFVPKSRKCSKPTSRRYADKPRPEPGESLASKVGKVAAVAGAVAGGAAVLKNRRAIGSGLRTAQKTIKAERNLYNTIKARKLGEKNTYGRAKYSRAAASRAARQEYIENRQAAVRSTIPAFSEMAIQKLSSQQIYEGLDRLPQQLQPGARRLIGKAKTVAASVGLEASGMEMVSVNDKNNFATYRAKDGSGTIASVGSVGDSLIIYNSEKKGEVRGVGKYGMAFTVDRKFTQRQNLAAPQAKEIATTTRAMFEEQKAQLPENAFVFNIAFKDDGLGKKREAIYKRQGFRPLPKGGEMWAIKDAGTFRKLTDPEMDALMDILRGRDDATDQPTRVQSFLATKAALAA